mgnify:FL=1
MSILDALRQLSSPKDPRYKIELEEILVSLEELVVNYNVNSSQADEFLNNLSLPVYDETGINKLLFAMVFAKNGIKTELNKFLDD